MMAQVLPPQMAIAIMAIPVVVANIWQFSQAERSTEVVARFWPTFIAILIGTWFGVKILATIDEKTLMFLVGVAVIVFAILQGSRFRLHLPERLVKPAGVFFGGASGLIGGVSSFFGPMLITYLISIRGLSKNQFVSSISFLYVSAVVPWTLTLYYFGHPRSAPADLLYLRHPAGNARSADRTTHPPLDQRSALSLPDYRHPDCFRTINVMAAPAH